MSIIHEEQSLERLISKCAVTTDCMECENNLRCSIERLFLVSDRDFEIYLEMTKQGMYAVNSENELTECELEKCIDALRLKRKRILAIEKLINEE